MNDDKARVEVDLLVSLPGFLVRERMGRPPWIGLDGLGSPRSRGLQRSGDQRACDSVPASIGSNEEAPDRPGGVFVSEIEASINR